MASTPCGLIADSTIVCSFSVKLGSTLVHSCPCWTLAAKKPELSWPLKQAILTASYSYLTPKAYFARVDTVGVTTQVQAELLGPGALRAPT